MKDLITNMATARKPSTTPATNVTVSSSGIRLSQREVYEDYSEVRLYFTQNAMLK